jgi:hypothetical protein
MSEARLRRLQPWRASVRGVVGRGSQLFCGSCRCRLSARVVRDVLTDDRVTAQVFRLVNDRDPVHNTWCGEDDLVGGLLGGLLGSGSVT